MLRLTEDEKEFLNSDDEKVLTSEQLKYIKVMQNKNKSLPGHLLDNIEL